jgi:hypothetical protein
MYIPANNYKIHQPTVKYADLLKPGHANPDFMRYELRRVWAVEGTLKDGFRHVYGKRVLFVDEDTGQAVAADMYDARGQLWQHAFINYYYSLTSRPGTQERPSITTSIPVGTWATTCSRNVPGTHSEQG